MSGNDGYYRQGMALTVGILIFVLVVYTLEKTGVPRAYSIALSSAFALAIYILGTFPAGTTRAGRFLTSDRTTRPGISAMAAASLVGFPLLILNGGELYFINPWMLIAIAIAISGGLALTSILVSRQFNAIHASDIADMLLERFETTVPARLFAAAGSVSGLILTACGLAAASLLVAWFFALSYTVSMLIVLVCCFLNAALGGISSVTRFAALSTMLLLMGLNLPLLVHTLVEHGFPVGHLSVGVSAIQPAAELEQQLSSLAIPLVSQRINENSAILDWQGGLLVLTGLIVMIACASLPSVVHHAATNHDDSGAGRAARRSILYAGFATASLFALLAFSKYGFYQSMLGLTLSEARVEAPFLFSWGERDVRLVEFCGKALTSADEVLSACADGIEHIVNIPDFRFEGALLLAAAPDISALPFAFTALLAIALIAVMISFTSANLLATVNNLVTAFYASLPGKVASGRVFMVRLCLVISLVVCTWLSVFIINDFGSAFMLALSLSCVSAVPALLGVFYVARSTPVAISTAIGSGFAICILYYQLSVYGVDFTPGTGDELVASFPGMAKPVPAELGAVFGLPFALFVLYLISGLAGSRQKEEAPAENASSQT